MLFKRPTPRRESFYWNVGRAHLPTRLDLSFQRVPELLQASNVLCSISTGVSVPVNSDYIRFPMPRYPLLHAPEGGLSGRRMFRHLLSFRSLTPCLISKNQGNRRLAYLVTGLHQPMPRSASPLWRPALATWKTRAGSSPMPKTDTHSAT